MSTSETEKRKELYEFGPFQVDPEKELLLRSGEPVPLTPKTFQILLVLLRHSQQVVTKDDLMKSVWPDTFVEEANLSRNIFMLRKALGDAQENHRYIITVPGRGYRLAETVRALPEPDVSIVATHHTRVQVEVKETKPWRWIALALAVIVVLAAGVVASRSFGRRKALTETDTIVLADFTNTTGDPVFDGTLRQGLSIQLEQSPFLSLISDQQVQQTLKLMGQPADAGLTPKIAYDLCQRTQSAAVISGSIASLGSQYVVGLRAVNCGTGNVLAEEQETASGKEKILAALGTAAIKLRGRLGESRGTVEKFDTPLEQATTPSMEALQAYSIGRRTQAVKNDFAGAVPFLQRAIQIDPNFAMAYAVLGSVYFNIGEKTLGAENARKAFEMHAPVSEPERFYIDSTYYDYVVGDMEKARQIYEVWSQTYSRSHSPPTRLVGLYQVLGQYDKALAASQEAVRLAPMRALTHSNLVYSYLLLNRLQEGRAAAEEAEKKGLGSDALRFNLYRIALLEGDNAAMARQVQWAKGQAEVEYAFLNTEGQRAAYGGHLEKARDYSRLAVASARQADKGERVLRYEMSAALREALFGNTGEARRRAAALRVPADADLQYGRALTLALAGDAAHAKPLAEDLAKAFPDDTIVHFNYLPTLRAQLALNRNQPSQAIEELQAATPYELGCPGATAFSPCMYPVYIRGLAYLAAHQGDRAANEFQKILDHPGVVIADPIGALAHLGLAHAYALQAQSAQGTDADAVRAKARAAYNDFLNLWKDADPGIPILKQARAEYAKLQ